MRINVISAGIVAASVVALLGASSSPAFAYGSEGMFGGRPNPDSSMALANPVEVKTDRPERAQSVMEHPRPDYDPAPITLGSFDLYPSLDIGQSFDDNIYATKSGKSSDAISNIRPVISALSNWNRHALSMTSFGDVNFFADNNSEDYRNFVTDLNGRYDIMTETWIAPRAGYQHLIEPRSSPDAVSGSEPTQFDVKTAGFTVHRGLGLLKADVNYDYKRFDFYKTPSALGPISQKDRNRSKHMVGGKIAYSVSENLKPYVKSNYVWLDYDNNPAHKSQGYETLFGSTADFGGITSIDLYAGWLSREFHNFTADSRVLVPTFGGRFDWNVTGKTSLVLEASRSLEETSSTLDNSYTSTGGSVTLTHELLRNVLLEGDFSFARSDYNGTSSRQDDELSAGMGGRYLINRNLYSDLNYTYTRHYSTNDPSEYIRNMATLRLGVRM
ncbi:MAG: outer membrane beta-barrel protein [Alphaproteobacteria bacterium]|nr:outer membrane beta-barrel protein [Alphaproteobacteria bacterium]